MLVKGNPQKSYLNQGYSKVIGCFLQIAETLLLKTILHVIE